MGRDVAVQPRAALSDGAPLQINLPRVCHGLQPPLAAVTQREVSLRVELYLSSLII